MTNRKTIARFLATVIGIVACTMVGAVPAAVAQSCIQDVWQDHGNKQGLTCTANDVSLASVTNICIKVEPPGGPLDLNGDGCKDENTCFGGQDVTFEADFTMPLTAQARYDLGLYTSKNGISALTGECNASVVTEANSTTFDNQDAAPDVCGDITDASNPQIITGTITVPCTDTNDDGKLNLPWCTTWRQPGANEVCDSEIFESAETFDAYPGSPSKCNCGVLDIDIFLETASITVIKSVNPTTVPETGGVVEYMVSVTNNAIVSDVTLDELTDSIYDNITTSGHDGITATTCTLATIDAGATYNCTFNVTMGAADEGTLVDDTVTACGTDEFGHTNLCDEDDATVTYTDVQTDPALEKVAASTQAVAVDVMYTVSVTNHSTVDDLTLNTLFDNRFLDITSVQGNVLSTNCGVPQVITPGGTYNCAFVGRIITTGTHVNTVDGSATDDDGVTYGAPPLQDSASVTITVTLDQ